MNLSIIQQQLHDAVTCTERLLDTGCHVVSVNIWQGQPRAEILLRDPEPLFAALTDLESQSIRTRANQLTVRTELCNCDVVWVAPSLFETA